MDFTQQEKNIFLIATSERADLGMWDKEIWEMEGPRAVFRLIWELEAEVNNGGFDQYAHNSSGAGAPRILDALGQIGAGATAAIVSKALAILGDIQWQDDDARRKAVKELDQESLDDLDDLAKAFFRYEDSLTELLFAFVIRNLASFPPP